MSTRFKFVGFLGICLAHWAEHLAQSVQLCVYQWPRHCAGGVLGLFYPKLVTGEWLHYAYAVAMFVGLGRLSTLLWVLIGVDAAEHAKHHLAWRLWMLAFVLQGWHLFEHSLLFVQAQLGMSDPTSVIQLFWPRIELHLVYNTAVTIPMVLAMVLAQGIRLHPQARVAMEVL